uniref:Uncharacterized protein n=1 Tax=Anguilla anguilla TaxID=7936 RepID=A0A0E9PUB6_ANGAN
MTNLIILYTVLAQFSSSIGYIKREILTANFISDHHKPVPSIYYFDFSFYLRRNVFIIASNLDGQ